MISASATVTEVRNYVKLTEPEIDAALADNAAALALTAKQTERWQKKCLCVVYFTWVTTVTPALSFDKQNNMDDWLILDKIDDAVVGTSVPYSYDNVKL